MKILITWPNEKLPPKNWIFHEVDSRAEKYVLLCLQGITNFENSCLRNSCKHVKIPNIVIARGVEGTEPSYKGLKRPWSRILNTWISTEPSYKGLKREENLDTIKTLLVPNLPIRDWNPYRSPNPSLRHRTEPSYKGLKQFKVRKEFSVMKYRTFL